MSKTISLNMIVKNESHIIKKTLEHLTSIFNFSYWVICDTGSTDNTQNIIIDFFAQLFLSEVLYFHQRHHRFNKISYFRFGVPIE